MKGLFLVGLLIVTQLALAQGLKCHKCIYDEIVDKDGDCEKNFKDEKYEVTCEDLGLNATNYYCAKWITGQLEGDMTIIIRDCHGRNEALPEEELKEDCNQGYDIIYNSVPYKAGLLCYCKDEDLCNSGVMAGLHLTLAAIGFLTFKLIQ